MNENLWIAIATVLLVVVGLIQIIVLFSQKAQARIALTEQYRQLWNSLKKDWGIVIFFGKEHDEYYQVLDEVSINNLRKEIKKHRLGTQTIWALESVRNVCGALSEVSTRILQGHLNISDIYPIFGTEFLRQCRSLRKLLDPGYDSPHHIEDASILHNSVRTEMQDWLSYHDGLRRRCLILIDLLWAESARLEDLPPNDMKNAADSKRITGWLNRKRIFQETIRLNGLRKVFLALNLSRFLGRAEYVSLINWKGINKRKLSNLTMKIYLNDKLKRKIEDFDNFSNKCEEVFIKLSNSDSRVKEFQDINMLHICPGGKSGEDDSIIEVFWSSRLYEPEIEENHLKKLQETSPILFFHCNDAGDITISIYPAKVEGWQAAEDRIFLHTQLDPKKLNNYKFIKSLWNDFVAYMEVSRLDGNPTVFQKFKVFRLRRFNHFVNFTEKNHDT